MTRDTNGFTVTTEEELEKAVAEDEETQKQESDKSTAPKYEDPEEATSFGKTAPRINKGAIIMTVLGAAVVVMIGSQIFSGREKKQREEAAGRAPEVAVPNFGDYRSRAYVPDEETEPIPSNLAPPPSMPSYAAQPVSRPAAAQQVQTVPAAPQQHAAPSSASYEAALQAELAARNSSMVPQVEGVLIGRTVPQSNQNPVSAVGGNSGVLSPEEYFQQRFGSSMPTSGTTAAVTNGSMGSSGQTEYHSQNMQSEKAAFYESGKDTEPTGQFIGENTLWMGTIVPGVLITGINTDLPGDIQARITENVYDSMTGKKLLIPQGTLLIASYNSAVSFAQSRVQIAWHTMIRPDGYQINLGNMNAVDAKGQSGVGGWVDEHLWQYLKAAGVISLFTILNSEFSYSTGATTNQTLQNLIGENQALVNQLANRTIDRVLDIQPTIRVQNGTKINIMLNKNLYIPPLEDYPTAGRYTRY